MDGWMDGYRNINICMYVCTYVGMYVCICAGLSLCNDTLNFT